MKIARQFILGIGMAALLPLTGAFGFSLPNARFISGRVLDYNGRPVAGARVLATTVHLVYLMDGNFEYGQFKGDSTHTRDDGRFVLMGDSDSLQRVVIVSPDDHLVWPARQSTAGQELNITLPEPATLIVRYDIPGDLPEAKPEMYLVTQKKEMPLWTNLGFVLSITTTNGGQIVLTNLTPGLYNFRRWKSMDREHGADTESRAFLLEAGGTQRVDMVRTNGQRIRGRVVGSGLAGASGGCIFVHSPEATGQPWPQSSRNGQKEMMLPNFDVTRFGPDGTFETAMLNLGVYTIVAHVYAPGAPAGGFPYHPVFVGVGKVTVSAVPLPPLTIQLAPAAYLDIVGRAVDDKTGEPIPDLMIQMGKVNPRQPGEIIWQEGFQGVDDKGDAWLENQKEGAAFRFLANGYVSQTFTREELLATGRTANLQVRMQRGGELHGVVLDHLGHPVARATIYLAPLELGFVRFGEVMSSGTVTNWAHTFALTDAAGRFSIGGVGTSKTRIIIVTEDGQMVRPVQVTGPGEDLKITLPEPATLVVRYDIPGDAAETYFELTLRTNKLELPLWKYIAPKTTARVPNGGQIVLSNLTAGTYDFSRIMMGGPTNGEYMFMYGDPPEVVQGGTRTLVLKPGRTREVRMVRSAGQRVQGQVTGWQGITNGQAFLCVGAAAVLSSPRGFKAKLEPCFDAVKLGEDGRFETALLEPGTYALVAEVFKWGDEPDRKPIADDEPQMGGQWFFSPQRLALVGAAKVTVTAKAPPLPVKIKLRPWTDVEGFGLGGGDALDDQTAKGLQITCVPSKRSFVVGEPVNLWCMVTNTTENDKTIAWHPSSASHFCLAKDEASWMTGILPLVVPKLRDSIADKSISGTPEYEFLLPPHTSLDLILTCKAERPEKVRGIIVYDPATHGGGFFGDEALAKAKRACIFSKPFEYEVTDARKE